jgi:hypothetical protein
VDIASYSHTKISSDLEEVDFLPILWQPFFGAVEQTLNLVKVHHQPMQYNPFSTF